MTSQPPASNRAPAVLIAAVASLGAGAVHAAAIGAHAEHPQVVKTFTVLAAVQLAWGVWFLVRPTRVVAAIGVVLGGAAVVGWIMAKTSGIGFIDGLDVAEPTQWADGACAALAAISTVVAAWFWWAARPRSTAALSAEPEAAMATEATTAEASAVVPTAPASRLVRGLAMVAVLALSGVTLTAMTAAANHHHDGDHAHSDEASTAHDHTDTTDHDHSETDTTDHDHAAGDDHGTTTVPAHEHSTSSATKPYDPSLPIDLSGTPGVTPQQQARAENLIAVTLARLPQFADWTTLEARGWHSIHDGGTGYEHFINWDTLDDGHVLDPDIPESVVFQMQPDGSKKLVSAMYFAEPGTTLDNTPDIGGTLTQWHVHDDLCFAGDPPKIAGLTTVGGACPPGTRKLGDPRPMIHVWIVPNECGPFAALEGVGAGQVKAGETRACDAAHGSHGH